MAQDFFFFLLMVIKKRKRAGCVCKGILVANVFVLVKGMVRVVSDFRADKTSHLRDLRGAPWLKSSKPQKCTRRESGTGYLTSGI